MKPVMFTLTCLFALVCTALASPEAEARGHRGCGRPHLIARLAVAPLRLVRAMPHPILRAVRERRHCGCEGTASCGGQAPSAAPAAEAAVSYAVPAPVCAKCQKKPLGI